MSLSLFRQQCLPLAVVYWYGECRWSRYDDTISSEEMTSPDTLYDPYTVYINYRSISYTTPKAAAYYYLHVEFNADAPEFCPGSGCGQLTGLSTDTGSSNSYYVETPVWDHANTTVMYWEEEYTEEGIPSHGGWCVDEQ